VWPPAAAGCEHGEKVHSDDLAEPSAFAIAAHDVRESALRRSGSICSRRRDLA